MSQLFVGSGHTRSIRREFLNELSAERLCQEVEDVPILRFGGPTGIAVENGFKFVFAPQLFYEGLELACVFG